MSSRSDIVRPMFNDVPTSQLVIDARVLPVLPLRPARAFRNSRHRYGDLRIAFGMSAGKRKGFTCAVPFLWAPSTILIRRGTYLLEKEKGFTRAVRFLWAPSKALTRRGDAPARKRKGLLSRRSLFMGVEQNVDSCR